MRHGGLATLALLVCGGALLAGCGGQTKTVTISSPPHARFHAGSHKVASTTTSTSSAPATTSAMSTETTVSSTVSVVTTAVRTSSEPAFVEQTKPQHPADVEAAITTVQHLGYTPSDPSQYRGSQTLAVLVGTKASAEGAHVQQAFFFLDGKYLGTDSSQPSTSVEVTSQGDTEVTLSYALFKPGGAETSNRASVTFQLNNGKLVALQQIPPAQPSNGHPGRL